MACMDCGSDNVRRYERDSMGGPGTECLVCGWFADDDARVATRPRFAPSLVDNSPP